MFFLIFIQTFLQLRPHNQCLCTKLHQWLVTQFSLLNYILRFVSLCSGGCSWTRLTVYNFVFYIIFITTLHCLQTIIFAVVSYMDVSWSHKSSFTSCRSETCVRCCQGVMRDIIQFKRTICGSPYTACCSKSTAGWFQEGPENLLQVFMHEQLAVGIKLTLCKRSCH